ncbi:galactosylceramide sulfotransferase-like [Branchiostoma floridae x Branchiostoma belcheri]
MFLLRDPRRLLRSFFFGTVFLATFAIIYTQLFYGKNKEEPRATISEAAIYQQTPGGSNTQATTPPHKSPTEKNTVVVETQRTCTPRKNFIFVKTHKTGSSSVTNLLQRYAIYHKLIVMMPNCIKCSLSWPTSPVRGSYLKSKTGKYNAIVHHTRYNKTWMNAMFPSDTAYITVLREPFSHLKSTVHYYNLGERLGKQSGVKNRLQPFLENPFAHRYAKGYKTCEVTFERTRNFQAFDLGYDLEWADDIKKAESFIQDLGREFTIVLILEHFDESLVLLRRKMCWKMKDILYDTTPKKLQYYSYKNYKPTEKEQANYKEFSKVDHMLYEFFNISLWKRIASEGPGFFAELEYYKELNTKVSKHCSQVNLKARNKGITIKSSKWNGEFHIDGQFCKRLTAKKTVFLDGPLRARLVKGGRKNKKVSGRCKNNYTIPKDKLKTTKK